jgi:hypothetical protein
MELSHFGGGMARGTTVGVEACHAGEWWDGFGQTTTGEVEW